MRMNNFFNYVHPDNWYSIVSAVIQPLHVFLEVLVSCSTRKKNQFNTLNNIPKFRAKQLETKLNILFESLELHQYKVLAMATLMMWYLMVWFLSVKASTLCGLMLRPLAWQCLKWLEVLGDRSSLICVWGIWLPQGIIRIGYSKLRPVPLTSLGSLWHVWLAAIMSQRTCGRCEPHV